VGDAQCERIAGDSTVLDRDPAPRGNSAAHNTPQQDSDTPSRY
jgi:hypothetical protein